MADRKDKVKNFKDFARYEDNPTSGIHLVEDIDILPVEEQLKVKALDDDVVMDEYYEKGVRIRVYDRKTFVKIFDGAKNELVNLSSSGIAMFSFIISNLKKQQDQIAIIPELFGKWYNSLAGYEKADFKMVCYRGVINLLENKFIFLKVGEGSYFINVNKFFNGRREKLPWLAEIDKRLEKGEHIPRKAVSYIHNYKPKNI